eukprot:CAMPEP_0178994178 /NCGR_PEP_ID=MMETSP0795-20121207/7128_1 /TAXON_ID=88552 /ORGANISM="Amoebophrya sp., Strain Ameob2" /LENGTH=149 /DNA_ID=CAMNT_0020686347 /DNA_START=751 /DNA_END=1200 /DNA_ORIENTATION=+
MGTHHGTQPVFPNILLAGRPRVVHVRIQNLHRRALYLRASDEGGVFRSHVVDEPGGFQLPHLARGVARALAPPVEIRAAVGAAAVVFKQRHPSVPLRSCDLLPEEVFVLEDPFRARHRLHDFVELAKPRRLLPRRQPGVGHHRFDPDVV